MKFKGINFLFTFLLKLSLLKYGGFLHVHIAYGMETLNTLIHQCAYKIILIWNVFFLFLLCSRTIDTCFLFKAALTSYLFFGFNPYLEAKNDTIGSRRYLLVGDKKVWIIEEKSMEDFLYFLMDGKWQLDEERYWSPDEFVRAADNKKKRWRYIERKFIEKEVLSRKDAREMTFCLYLQTEYYNSRRSTRFFKEINA